MRRGETAKYVQGLATMADLYQAFDRFAASLAAQYVQSPTSATQVLNLWFCKPA